MRDPKPSNPQTGRISPLTHCPRRENASSVLEEYFAKLGGREKLFEETATALRGKKRGRPGSSTPTTNGKKAKKNGHPLDEEAPRTARVEQWRPPAGLWEEHIAQLDAFEDEETGKLMVYLTWKNGHKTQHETSVIYKRCPQKVRIPPFRMAGSWR